MTNAVLSCSFLREWCICPTSPTGVLPLIQELMLRLIFLSLLLLNLIRMCSAASDARLIRMLLIIEYCRTQAKKDYCQVPASCRFSNDDRETFQVHALVKEFYCGSGGQCCGSKIFVSLETLPSFWTYDKDHQRLSCRFFIK